MGEDLEKMAELSDDALSFDLLQRTVRHDSGGELKLWIASVQRAGGGRRAEALPAAAREVSERNAAISGTEARAAAGVHVAGARVGAEDHAAGGRRCRAVRRRRRGGKGQDRHQQGTR